MYARSFGDVFSPAALIVRASFSLCIRTSSALRLISMPIHDATPCRVIPIRKKMGARSQRWCLPGLIPNPEVKPTCVSPNTVVRESTGKEVTVPLFFHSNSSNIGRCLNGTGLFLFTSQEQFKLYT